MPTRYSNDNIYKLINDLRLEMKSDISGVSSRVDNLRETVEANTVSQSVSSTKLGFLIGGISLASSALMTAILNAVVKKF